MPPPPLRFTARGRMKQSVLAARQRASFAHHHQALSKTPPRREAERREAQPFNGPRHTIRCCHLNVRGARKRAKNRGALAFRRSTADSPARSQPPLAQPQAVFPGPGYLRGSPAFRRFRFSELLADRSFCRTNGIQGRPGAGLRIPPAGTALAPPSGSHPECALR